MTTRCGRVWLGVLGMLVMAGLLCGQEGPPPAPRGNSSFRQPRGAAPPKQAYDAVFRVWADGDQAKAEHMLDALVREHPQDQRLLFFRACCERSRFGVGEAAVQFARVVRMDPKTIEAQCAQHVLAIDALCAQYVLPIDARQDADQHLADLGALIKKNPGEPLLTWMAAVGCRTLEVKTYKREYTLQGIEHYRLLLKQIAPAQGSSLVHQTFANMLDTAKEYQESLKHRELAVQLEPADWSYQGMANTLRALKEDDRAHDADLKAGRLRRGESIAKPATPVTPAPPTGSLGNTLRLPTVGSSRERDITLVEGVRPPDALRAIEAAAQKARDGQHAAAADALAAAFRTGGRNDAALMSQGRDYQALGQHDKAIPFLLLSSRRGGLLGEQARLQAAESYIQLKQPRSAVAIFQDAVKANPQDRAALGGLARVCNMAGDNEGCEQARRDLRAVVRAAGSNTVHSYDIEAFAVNGYTAKAVDNVYASEDMQARFTFWVTPPGGKSPGPTYHVDMNIRLAFDLARQGAIQQGEKVATITMGAGAQAQQFNVYVLGEPTYAQARAAITAILAGKSPVDAGCLPLPEKFRRGEAPPLGPPAAPADPQQALAYYQAAVKADPSDFQSLVKVIQLASSLGQPQVRDQAREALFKLHRSGQVEALSRLDRYVREEFTVQGRKVVSREHLRPDVNKTEFLYSFQVYTAQTPHREAGDYNVHRSPVMTDIARRTKVTVPEGKILIAFVGTDQSPGSGFGTYGYFVEEPTYEHVKALVTELIEGKSKLTQHVAHEFVFLD